ILNNLGSFYRETGNYVRSAAYYKEAQSFVGRDISSDDPLNGAILNGLAAVALLKGDVRGAIKNLERSLHIREATLGPDHLDVSETLNNLGAAQWRAHQYAKAESTLVQALSITEAHLGSDHPEVAVILTNLGILYQTQKRNGEAEKLLRRALS